VSCLQDAPARCLAFATRILASSDQEQGSTRKVPQYMATRTALSDGAIAGIAVGAAFGVVLTAIALAYGLYHHRQRSRRGRSKDVEKQHGRRAPESVGSAAGLVTAKDNAGGREGRDNGGGGSGRTGKLGNMPSVCNVGLRPDERAEREERSRERERAKERSLSAMGRRNTG
jgi:hypothetical protein